MIKRFVIALVAFMLIGCEKKHQLYECYGIDFKSKGMHTAECYMDVNKNHTYSVCASLGYMGDEIELDLSVGTWSRKWNDIYMTDTIKGFKMRFHINERSLTPEQALGFMMGKTLYPMYHYDDWYIKDIPLTRNARIDSTINQFIRNYSDTVNFKTGLYDSGALSFEDSTYCLTDLFILSRGTYKRDGMKLYLNDVDLSHTFEMIIANDSVILSDFFRFYEGCVFHKCDSSEYYDRLRYDTLTIPDSLEYKWIVM